MGSCFGRRVGLQSVTRSRRGSNESLLSSSPQSEFVADPPPSYEASLGVSGAVLAQMTEDERYQLVRRATLIQLLPSGVYSTTKSGKKRECVICMLDFAVGDPIRLLPCMHLYHVHCIDDWLQRSFTCPLCMEQIDEALLQTTGLAS